MNDLRFICECTRVWVVQAMGERYGTVESGKRESIIWTEIHLYFSYVVATKWMPNSRNREILQSNKLYTGLCANNQKQLNNLFHLSLTFYVRIFAHFFISLSLSFCFSPIPIACVCVCVWLRTYFDICENSVARSFKPIHINEHFRSHRELRILNIFGPYLQCSRYTVGDFPFRFLTKLLTMQTVYQTKLHTMNNNGNTTTTTTHTEKNDENYLQTH